MRRLKAPGKYIGIYKRSHSYSDGSFFYKYPAKHSLRNLYDRGDTTIPSYWWNLRNAKQLCKKIFSVTPPKHILKNLYSRGAHNCSIGEGVIWESMHSLKK